MTRVAVPGVGLTGLKWPNYVNGRLLTAQDLQADQDAVLRRDTWLGRAVGQGVAEGLEVSGSPGTSVLQVLPGTGVCPGGTAVHLDAPVSLDLTVVTSTAPVDGAKFADCVPTTTATSAPSAGAYVLTIAPASSYAGHVPTSSALTADHSGCGCADCGDAAPSPPSASCTSRWEVEDVVFAVVRLDEFTNATTPANRRNLLAHWCYGSSSLTDLALSGFTDPAPYAGIDLLADLTPCDLPVAVFDWDGSQLEFVDCWSARRRVTRRSAARATDPGPLVGDERTAEGEARLLQFHDQLAGLVAAPATRTFRALDVFPMLPPAGLVPIDPLQAAELLLKTAQPSFDLKEAKRQAKTSLQKRKRADFSDEDPTLLKLLDDGGEFTTGGSPTKGDLGLISKELKQIKQELAALRAELDRLTESKGGADGAGSTVTAKAAGQQLAGRLVALLADTAGPVGGGVDPARFFSGIPVRVGIVELETVDFTIRRSWYDTPIDLGAVIGLNVYFVYSTDREELAPYLLFSKRHPGVRWVDSAIKAWGDG
jgi:hypothetical protein